MEREERGTLMVGKREGYTWMEGISQPSHVRHLLLYEKGLKEEIDVSQLIAYPPRLSVSKLTGTSAVAL